MILQPAAPFPPAYKTMKMKTARCISDDSEASRPFPKLENDGSPMYLLWFWRQLLSSHPLPKAWKWSQTFAFLMILERPAHFQNYENDNSPMHFLWFWSHPHPSRSLLKLWKWWQSHAYLMILEPSAPLPLTAKTMKMMTVLCISYDFGAIRTPPAHF